MNLPYNFLPTPNFEQPIDVREENDARYYHFTNNRVYPSITTVLSHYKSDALKEWIAKTDPVKRAGILSKSNYRGTNFHEIVEHYIKGEPLGGMPVDKERLIAVKPLLRAINNIHCQETVLYSDRLKIAGRTDLIAEFNGVPSIIDFKTARREKDESHVIKYFEQKTGYSLMYEERTGIKIDQIVTIIAIDEDPQPQLFVRTREPYIDSLVDKIKNFPRREE